MTQAIAYNSCTPTTQFTYVANVDPLPLITSSEGAEPVIGSLQVVITTGDEGPYTITSDDSISFAIPYCDPDANPPCSTGGVMQNVNDATPSWFDDTNEWTFSLQGTEDGVGVFTLSPVGSFTLPSGYTFGVELAGFETVEQPCVSTVNIAESVGGTTGINCFDVATFPVGFFFNSLEAVGATGSDPAPLAEVPNGTQVRLNWNSSAIAVEQIAIYMSGASGPITPTEIDHWITPDGLTDDTVFTVAITADVSADDPITLSLSVAVTVSQPDIVAGSVTVNGAVTAGSVSAGSVGAQSVSAVNLTTTGPFSLSNGFGLITDLSCTGNWSSSSNGLISSSSFFYYQVNGDGFVWTFSDGWYDPPTNTTGWATLNCILGPLIASATGTFTDRSPALYNQSNSSLIPVMASSIIAVWTNLNLVSVSSETAVYTMCSYIPFGNGTIVQLSEDQVPADVRERIASRALRLPAVPSL